MKKIILVSSLAFMILLLGSCLTTLHPIFTEKDLVSDPRLNGKWSNIEDGSTANYRLAQINDVKSLSTSMQRNVSKIYMLEERDAQGLLKSKQYAFMVRLGKYYYMDFYPTRLKQADNEEKFFAAHYIPMHSIYRIRFKDDHSFEMQQLDAGYLENLIKNKKIRIRHEVTEDGNYVITAPTEELQKYIIKYSEVPEAYSKDNSATYSKMN
jgi:hypothetical protein